MIDFELKAEQIYSKVIQSKGIYTFKEACEYIQNLPYGRISDRSKFELVIEEGKGTCSSKHGLLAGIAEENNHKEVELMVGIFQMSPETHPVLTSFFEGKTYPHIPEAHCYLRFDGERYDYTSNSNEHDANKLLFIREQRVDPHQAAEWKEVIQQDYIKRLLVRKPEFQISFEDLWKDREECIRIFSKF